MQKFLGEGDTVIYRCDQYHTPGFERETAMVDSIIVSPRSPLAETVTVFSYGRVAGTLTLPRGVGEQIARKLLD